MGVLGSKKTVVATRSGDAPALVVANSAHGILFATPNARVWLRTFFPARNDTDVLPPRISRWLEAGAPPAAAGIRARRSGSSLVVSRYAPQPGECVALLLDLVDEKTRPPASSTALSKRQQDVLRWVASGKSNKAIGVILKISPKTVGKHVENVFRKLGVTSRMAAANAYTGYTGGRD